MAAHTPPIALPTPGSAGFSPALVRAVYAAPSLRGWQPDGTLLAVFLLALVARRGGVLIDVVREHGYPLPGVNRVMRTAVALAECVFGLETRTIHVAAHSTAADVSFEPRAACFVVTGLEDAPPPVLVKLRNEVASANKWVRPPLLVWVRSEDKADDSPPWLIDLFACSIVVVPEDIDPPPAGVESAALIPPDYVADLRTLLEITHVHPPLEVHISNLVAALSLHPALASSISARAEEALNRLIRAQRLLASPFDLPPNWEDNLHTWQHEVGNPNAAARRQVKATGGLSGGPGGVDTWARRAGEVPRTAAVVGPGCDEWYCLPENVAGAWALAVRHRVRVREPGQGALYQLNGTARERAAKVSKHEGSVKEAAGRRREVDQALEELLLTV
ncbi:hypothetical protein Q8F55_003999 [Vanrija albida]|uniref:Uncharacterized protein n=1 Tax=Vanrija albida TaxID=181172 RepID=A0ABR3Q5J0_9TREE